MKILPSFKDQKQANKRAELYRELMRREAKIGGELFGPIQPGGHREFFCLDEHTWIWHEEWVDQQTNASKVVTTRYDIRPSGILKSQNNQGYRYIDMPETRRFYRAMLLYRDRVFSELYGQPA